MKSSMRIYDGDDFLVKGDIKINQGNIFKGLPLSMVCIILSRLYDKSKLIEELTADGNFVKFSSIKDVIQWVSRLIEYKECQLDEVKLYLSEGKIFSDINLYYLMTHATQGSDDVNLKNSLTTDIKRLKDFKSIAEAFTEPSFTEASSELVGVAASDSEEELAEFAEI